MEIDTVLKNIKDMLAKRGDNVDMLEEHEAAIDREEFYNDRAVIHLHTSDTTVIFALTKKLRKTIIEELKLGESSIDTFINTYNNKKNIIIVFNDDTISAPILAQLNKYDKLFQKIGGMLQYFRLKQLMFNPTEHELVPEHVKLTAEEANELMAKYLIKNKLHMPIILHNDIIAKWLGLKQGDIVKIIRYNENSGVSYYYRYCI